MTAGQVASNAYGDAMNRGMSQEEAFEAAAQAARDFREPTLGEIAEKTYDRASEAGHCHKACLVESMQAVAAHERAEIRSQMISLWTQGMGSVLAAIDARGK